MEKYIIKNMVCPRCLTAVKNIFVNMGLDVISITLGEVTTEGELLSIQKLEEELSKLGFELLDNKQARLINQIKSIIIQKIHHEAQGESLNFSTIISQELHYDYSHLSRLFSSIEGRTIEKYILQQKIEKVKEFLVYDQLNLSEIADKMSYSSAAHLSTQFKKVTGMTPSSFKKIQSKNRTPLNDI